MLLFEISNPSDRAYIQADRYDVACAAVLFLGKGKYGIREYEASDVARARQDLAKVAPFSMPPFILGGATDWFKHQFHKPIEEWLAISDNKAAMADALDTVMLGKVEDIIEIRQAMARAQTDEERTRIRDEYHDRKRTSMNNFGARAWNMAAAIRRTIEGS